jgi:anti-sigma B factor antagonist
MITVNKLDNSDKTMVEINREKLDVLNMKRLKEKMLEIIADGNTNIIINLKQITFIDSSGLSVLISLFKHIKTLNGSMVLCGLNTQPTELLEITQLDKIFTISEVCN